MSKVSKNKRKSVVILPFIIGSFLGEPIIHNLIVIPENREFKRPRK